VQRGARAALLMRQRRTACLPAGCSRPCHFVTGPVYTQYTLKRREGGCSFSLLTLPGILGKKTRVACWGGSQLPVQSRGGKESAVHARLPGCVPAAGACFKGEGEGRGGSARVGGRHKNRQPGRPVAPAEFRGREGAFLGPGSFRGGCPCCRHGEGKAVRCWRRQAGRWG
jgi:hypothetical protein